MFCAVFMLTAFMAQSQTVIGTWKTIDDETGEAKSHVQLYEENGKVYGRVTELLRKNTDPNRICDKCTDDRKNQKVKGMQIVRDMQLKSGMYQSGTILDPEKGKVYGCKFWLESGNGNVLVVRGSIGPFYRTQKWYRVQ